ncbi:cytadherence high molecular weight protein 2-like [Plutella xylostella]|uniref:cytadherence high molecular weight protein 2-like n=1 Tax=Plutella xylostella TaxID=51655 RepID=UPI00203257DA|nr:cytadherence high molecular weight protein 2-like [Plutella xylostella]
MDCACGLKKENVKLKEEMQMIKMEFHELRQRIRDFEEDRRRQDECICSIKAEKKTLAEQNQCFQKELEELQKMPRGSSILRDCICGVKKENVQLKQCNEALQKEIASLHQSMKDSGDMNAERCPRNQQHSHRLVSERHRELRGCRGCLLDQLDHTAEVLEERSRQLAAARTRVRDQDKIIKEIGNSRTCKQGITAKLESLSELRSDNRDLVDENMKLENENAELRTRLCRLEEAIANKNIHITENDHNPNVNQTNCKCDLRSANLRLQEENAKYELDNSSLRSALSQLERTVADYEQRLSCHQEQGSITSAIPPHWLEGATVRRMRPGLCGQDFRPRALVASMPLDQVLASDDVTPCGRGRYTFVQSFNVFSADTHTRVEESPQSSEEALPETWPDQPHDRDDCLCELRKLNERLIQENAQYEVDNAELHVTVAELEKQLQDNVQLASCNCELKKLNEELKEENMKYKVENDGLRKQMAAMEGTISNYEDHVQDLQRNYEAEREEIKKETMELVEENAKFECEKAALCGEVRRLEQSVEALKQEYEQKLLLKQEELECLSGIQEANDQIIEENKTYAETIHKLEESISRMRKEYELKLRKQGEELECMCGLKEENKQLMEDNARLTAELSELQASMVAWEKDLAGRDQRVKQHEDRIKALEEQLGHAEHFYSSGRQL